MNTATSQNKIIAEVEVMPRYVEPATASKPRKRTRKSKKQIITFQLGMSYIVKRDNREFKGKVTAFIEHFRKDTKTDKNGKTKNKIGRWRKVCFEVEYEGKIKYIEASIGIDKEAGCEYSLDTLYPPFRMYANNPVEGATPHSASDITPEYTFKLDERYPVEVKPLYGNIKCVSVCDSSVTFEYGAYSKEPYYEQDLVTVPVFVDPETKSQFVHICNSTCYAYDPKQETSQPVDIPEEKTDAVQDNHALSLIANSELNISDDWNKLDYMTNIDCELWCIQHDKIAERNNTLRIQNCKTPEQAKALLDSGSGETLCLIATKIHAHYQDNWRDYHLRASILARLFPDNAELQNEFNSLITIPILRDVMIPPQNIGKGYSVYRRANEEYHENARFNKKIIDQCVTRQDILNVLRSISGASIYCQAQYDRLKGVPSAIPVDKSLSHEQEKIVIHDELAALYADALIARRERKLRSKRKVIQKEKTSETQEPWGEVAHELADPVQQLEALPATASQPVLQKQENEPLQEVITEQNFEHIKNNDAPVAENAPKTKENARKRRKMPETNKNDP